MRIVIIFFKSESPIGLILNRCFYLKKIPDAYA